MEILLNQELKIAVALEQKETWPQLLETSQEESEDTQLSETWRIIFSFKHIYIRLDIKNSFTFWSFVFFFSNFNTLC